MTIDLFMFFTSASRSHCRFFSSASSIRMDLMLRLFVISALYGSLSSGGVELDRRSERALAFNEKLATSSPHVVDVKEDILSIEEATALHY